MEAQIALRISGNKISNEGFRSLVDVGAYGPDIKDGTNAGLMENEYYFYVRHEPAQIVYTVQKSRIRSNGSAREGRLLMGIGIPKGYVLDGGLSPYDLLMDVYKTFISKYTMSLLGSAQFSNEQEDPAVFASLLSRYNLVPKTGKYVTMKPNRDEKAFLLIPQPVDIRKFFMDTQYDELAQYGEIVIAQEGNTMYPRLNVQIPRPISYPVFVNDKLQGKLSSKSEVFTARDSFGEFFEAVPVTFSISDIEAGKNIPGVVFDPVQETVKVQLEKKPKEITWKLEITGDNPGLGKLQLRDITTMKVVKIKLGFTFILKGDENNHTFDLNCTDGNFIKGTLSKNNSTKEITCNFRKIQVAPPVVAPSTGAAVTTKQQTDSPRRITLDIEGTKETMINIKVSDGSVCILQRVKVNSNVAYLEIPHGILRGNTLKISASTDADEVAGPISCSKNEGNLCFHSIGFFKRRIGHLLLGTLVGILIGVFIGVAIDRVAGFDSPKSKKEGKAIKHKKGKGNITLGDATSTIDSTAGVPDSFPDETSRNNDSSTSSNASSGNDEKAIKYNDDLKNANATLKFTTVKSIQSFVGSCSGDVAIKEELRSRANAYSQAVVYIEKRDFDKLVSEDFSKEGKYGKYLSVDIRKCLQNLSRKCDQGALYSKVEEANARKAFNSLKDINCFGDLTKVRAQVMNNQ